MIYAILSVALAGSLYGNYYFYTKLKAAAAGIVALTAELTSAVAVPVTPKAV